MEDEIIIASYHEAGHALLAYIVNWSIKSTSLNIENEKLIHGVTKYDFKDDKINDIVNLRRRILCLMGGPISQAIYEKKEIINFDTLERDGETIDLLLSQFSKELKEEIIKDSIEITTNLLSVNENKNALESIANKLINNHKIIETEYIELLSEYKIVRMSFD